MPSPDLQQKICVGESFPPREAWKIVPGTNVSPAPPDSATVIVIKGTKGQTPIVIAKSYFTDSRGQYATQQVLIEKRDSVDATALNQAETNYHNSCAPASQNDYAPSRVVDIINNDVTIQGLLVILLVLLGIKSFQSNKRR